MIIDYVTAKVKLTNLFISTDQLAYFDSKIQR